jgi:predicted nuclease with RNAse H fold
MKWVVIDSDSKMAGTTALAYADPSGKIRFTQSRRKQDADRFLQQWLMDRKPETIFLDAPLSLPAVYLKPGGEGDFFYRKAARELRAMSPRFLGGLTARAMRLRRELEKAGLQVKEVYPAELARSWSLKERGYKKSVDQIPANVEHLCTFTELTLGDAPANWHQFDALLAFCSGWRFYQNQHTEYGDPGEGLIIV